MTRRVAMVDPRPRFRTPLLGALSAMFVGALLIGLIAANVVAVTTPAALGAPTGAEPAP